MTSPHTLEEIDKLIGTLCVLGILSAMWSAIAFWFLWSQVSALKKRLEGGK